MSLTCAKKHGCCGGAHDLECPVTPAVGRVITSEGTETCATDCDHCAFQDSLTREEREDMSKMNAALARWRAKKPHPIQRGEETGTTGDEVARGHCDRCDRCGWPLGGELGQCRINDCSMRPLPARLDVCQGCGARFVGSPAPVQPDPDAAVRADGARACECKSAKSPPCAFCQGYDREAGDPELNAIWARYEGHLTFAALGDAFAAGRDEGAREEREALRKRLNDDSMQRRVDGWSQLADELWKQADGIARRGQTGGGT